MRFVKCACELRSPAQFTDAGFVAFNRHYFERLAARGIFREEVNLALALKKRIDAIKDEAIRRRLKWDHEFESAFLQRRVCCELDFGRADLRAQRPDRGRLKLFAPDSITPMRSLTLS
jgi:hypothetical protein